MPSVTDAQLNSWASNSFQVMAGYTPSNRSTDMQLDASKYVAPKATFIQSAQELRAGSSSMQIQVTTVAASAIEHQCNVLAYALPNDWNVTYYSPYRVLLIAYWLVSGDPLADSREDCANRMQFLENWLSSRGFNCPASGRYLWGDAGYVYSRPVSTFFSDAMQLDLLNRYAAVHGLQ